MSLLTMAPPMLSDIPTPSPSPHSSSPSTSSLLFGFLISFLALFTIFIAYGLGSRYMVDQRRRRRASEFDSLHVRRRRRSKPALWDVGAVLGNEKWEDMMPLSVELLRTSTSPPASPDRGNYSFAEQVLQLSQGFGRGGRWSFTSPVPRTPSHAFVPSTSQDSEPTNSGGPVDLQIAVLIVMPTSASHPQEITRGRDASLIGHKPNQHNVDLSNLVIGVTAIPWDKERMDFG